MQILIPGTVVNLYLVAGVLPIIVVCLKQSIPSFCSTVCMSMFYIMYNVAPSVIQRAL